MEENIDSTRCIEWHCRDRILKCGERTLIMGILNVTPDSFFDGGRYLGTVTAVTRGVSMIAEGADMIDVGGESTRPGAEPVGIREEIQRVIPVVERLCSEIADGKGRSGTNEVIVSVDTTKAEVAKRAIAAGARVINDVSAMTGDPEMVDVAGETGAGVILMHMRGTPGMMQDDPRYDDVTADVRAFFESRIGYLTAHGIDVGRLAVDPGIGFGKTVAHNINLLRSLGCLGELGRPVVVGVSRKSFLGTLTGRTVGKRLAASVAALSFCAMNGAHVARVHDVGESADAARVIRSLVRENEKCS